MRIKSLIVFLLLMGSLCSYCCVAKPTKATSSAQANTVTQQDIDKLYKTFNDKLNDETISRSKDKSELESQINGLRKDLEEQKKQEKKNHASVISILSLIMSTVAIIVCVIGRKSNSSTENNQNLEDQIGLVLKEDPQIQKMLADISDLKRRLQENAKNPDKESDDTADQLSKAGSSSYGVREVYFGLPIGNPGYFTVVTDSERPQFKAEINGDIASFEPVSVKNLIFNTVDTAVILYGVKRENANDITSCVPGKATRRDGEDGDEWDIKEKAIVTLK